MAKGSLQVGIRIDGVRETLAAIAKLPKDAQNALRDAAKDLAEDLAVAARAAAIEEGSQAALLAVTVKPARDRVPVVVAGGTKKLGRNNKPAFKLLFGAEFGANRFQQFKPHIGTAGYWFFPTIEHESAAIAKRWLQAADEVVEKFGGV